MIHPTDHSLPSSVRSAGHHRAPMVSCLSNALGHALRPTVLATPALSPRTPPAQRLQQRSAGWQCRPPAARSLAPATARAHRYRQGPRLASSGKGLALVELMLVVGTIMVVSGGIFAVYKATDSKARADREIKNAGEIADNLNRLMASGVNFGELTQDYAISTHIFPERMVKSAQASTGWGGVLIEPTAIRGVDNQGAKITYTNVPSEACATFVRGASSGFYEIRINGQELRSNYTTIVPTALSSLCGAQDKATVEFIYARNEGTGLAVDALTPCTVPAPETSVEACPPGQAGSMTRTRSFICQSSYGPATPGPWSAPTSTCAPLCAPQLPTPNPEYATQTQTASRPTACPAGQLTPAGATSFTQTRTEQLTQSRTASCPAPTGPYTWGPWSTQSPWAAVSGPAGLWSPTNGCAPKCVLPTPSVEPETQTQPVSSTASCPAGQLGLITYTHEETRTRTRTASCPAPTGAYAWGTPTAWSPWSPSAGPAGQPSLVSNTCAPQCVAPSPASTPESQPVSCAAGRVTPAGASSFTQTRTKTVSYSCPAPTGSYIANPAAYTPWSPDEATACAPKCVAPAALTETRTSTPCPSGQTGVITEKRTTTYSCPTPTGTATPSYSPWSVTSNTCVAACSAPPTSYGTETGSMNDVSYPSCYEADWATPRPPVGTTVYFTGTRPYQWTPASRTWKSSWSCPAGASQPTNTFTYTSDWYATGPMVFSNSCHPYWYETKEVNYYPPGWVRAKWASPYATPKCMMQRRVDGNGPNQDARIWVVSYSYDVWVPVDEFAQQDYGSTCVPCERSYASTDCSGNPRP